MTWNEANGAPTLREIEDVILKLRKRMSEKMAEVVLESQESVQPANGVKCEVCGKELRYKGRKKTRVTSRVGELKVERGHYRCPECQAGHFPPGSTTGIVGSALE
jgi:uncharacterized protein with PIN domain